MRWTVGMGRRIGSLALLTMVILGAIAPLDASEGTNSVAGDGHTDTRAGYIVELDAAAGDPAAAAADHANRHGGVVRRVYRNALRGYSMDLTAAQAQRLARDPGVLRIERDLGASVNAGAGAVGAPGGDAEAKGGKRTPPPPPAQILPWGVDRVDADRSSTIAGDGTGSIDGVTVYVIDTGVEPLPDLNVVDRVNFAPGRDVDCHGHGTHVAGIAGARDNDRDVVGVASGVAVVSVRVLNCQGFGSWSDIIAGVDWVTAHHTAGAAIANMSLGGGANDIGDEAVRRSARDGIVYTLAAGNSGADACGYSPARAGTASGIITVAATGDGVPDDEASFSNYGECVDLWAPGVAIPSLLPNGSIASWSGTSMAAPHVAGGAALALRSTQAAPLSCVAFAPLPGDAASPQFTECVLKALADTPGSTSKDGRAITRLAVRAL